MWAINRDQHEVSLITFCEIHLNGLSHSFQIRDIKIVKPTIFNSFITALPGIKEYKIEMIADTTN